MKSESKKIKHLFQKLERLEGLQHGELTYNDKNHVFNAITTKKNTIRLSIFFFIIIAIASMNIIINQLDQSVSNPETIPTINPNRHNLHKMIIHNQFDQLKTLLSKRQYMDTVDSHGWTPLHWSVMLNNREMTILLLKNGASLDVKSNQAWFIYPAGSTPRDIAVLNNNQSLLPLL
jgi:ankyrin repeat protein